MKVIGERVDGVTQFTVYCDGREFSTLEHGEQIFEALAEHIMQRRRGAKQYPIYITDLDLSKLDGDRLQTIHYLQYKKKIEDRLAEILAG